MSRPCWHFLQAGHSLTSVRSEERTSELQSPCNLVCRLLLEKKIGSAFVASARQVETAHLFRGSDPAVYRRLHSASVDGMTACVVLPPLLLASRAVEVCPART